MRSFALVVLIRCAVWEINEWLFLTAHEHMCLHCDTIWWKVMCLQILSLDVTNNLIKYCFQSYLLQCAKKQCEHLLERCFITAKTIIYENKLSPVSCVSTFLQKKAFSHKIMNIITCLLHARKFQIKWSNMCIGLS